MAVVRLGRHEAEKGGLPPVCLRCGAPATMTKAKQFRWYPSWVNILILVGLLPYIIVAAIMTKRMRIAVPLCAAHRSHWLWNDLLVPCGLAVVIFFPCAGGFFLDAVVGSRAGNSIGLFVVFSFLLGLIAWIILAVVVGARTIKPQEITDRSITLTGVDEAFVTALHRQHDLAAERHPSPSPSSEQYYDPQRGPR
jgi:hypothetical protein